MSDDIVWLDRTRNWLRWSEDERNAVESFLRDHDIDPADVLRADGNELTVRLLPSGSTELSVWVTDKEDGALVRCPTCPACVRQKLATRAVTTALPTTSTAWVTPSATPPKERARHDPNCA